MLEETISPLFSALIASSSWGDGQFDSTAHLSGEVWVRGMVTGLKGRAPGSSLLSFPEFACDALIWLALRDTATLLRKRRVGICHSLIPNTSTVAGRVGPGTLALWALSVQFSGKRGGLHLP